MKTLGDNSELGALTLGGWMSYQTGEFSGYKSKPPGGAWTARKRGPRGGTTAIDTRGSTTSDEPPLRPGMRPR